MRKLDQFKALLAILAAFSACSKAPDTRSSALYPIPIGSGMGFMNARGKPVIARDFEAVAPFSEGLAAVRRSGKWGYINTAGELVIPCFYRMAGEFRKGLAIVDLGTGDHSVGVIDTRGNTVVAPLFRSLSDTGGPNGYVLGQKDTGQGFCFFDAYGNCMLGPYQLAFGFSESRARVRGPGSEGLIDASGKMLETGSVAIDGNRFSEGRIAIRRDKKLGYIDLEGKIAVEPRYDQGGEFSEGMAAVQSEGHWVFISKSGEIMAEFPAGVAFAYPLSEGLSLVTADTDGGGRKMGYVDRNGKWAIKPAYDDAEPFKNGLALVGLWRGEQVMYINPAGNVVWRK